MKRNLNDMVVAGVCSGIARHFGIDPIWVRLAFVALGLSTVGTLILVYLILWALM